AAKVRPIEAASVERPAAEAGSAGESWPAGEAGWARWARPAVATRSRGRPTQHQQTQAGEGQGLLAEHRDASFAEGDVATFKLTPPSTTNLVRPPQSACHAKPARR